jgi:hypothetical protein
MAGRFDVERILSMKAMANPLRIDIPLSKLLPPFSHFPLTHVAAGLGSRMLFLASPSLPLIVDHAWDGCVFKHCPHFFGFPSTLTQHNPTNSMSTHFISLEVWRPAKGWIPSAPECSCLTETTVGVQKVHANSEMQHSTSSLGLELNHLCGLKFSTLK